MTHHLTRDQDLPLLRKTVQLVSNEDAARHSMSFAASYERSDCMNETAPAAEHRRHARKLCDADALAFCDEFVHDIEGDRHLARMLAKLMQEVVQIAQSAGTDLTQFRAMLERRNEQLQSPLQQLAIRAIVAGLIGDTQKMAAMTEELTASLTTNLKDVEDLQSRLQRAEQEALLDPLTGLLNRRGFERSVRSLADEAGMPTRCALLYIDIDRFKHINDRYGHLLGDKVLQAVASVLQANVKGRDIIARFGGEEFVVLLPGTAVPSAQIVAEQIRASVALCPIQRTGIAIDTITVSIGVCQGDAVQNLPGLLERADRAMYAAKQAGRDRVRTAE
jgi:diguanylate cyclase